MNFPVDLYYTKEHEWIKVNADQTAIVGITDYAQDQLGDIVFVEIETKGETLEKNAIFGTVEAVKTVSDLFLPISGTILEVNQDLVKNPEIINENPYEKGWMIKIQISDPKELDELLKVEAYEALTKV